MPIYTQQPCTRLVFAPDTSAAADGGMTQLTGDVTAGPGSGSQAVTIAARAVTVAKFQAIATQRLLGRNTAGSGDVEELDAATVLALIAAVNKAGDTMTGALINSANGALSAPAFSITGTPITGGTATTTKPLALIEPAGTTSTGWTTSGTMLGVNAPSGFSGYLQDWQVNGATKAYIHANGALTIYGNMRLQSAQTLAWNDDAILRRAGTANLALGAADAASPVAQTISVQNVAAGTTNTAGVTTTVKCCAGTGTAASGTFVIQLGTPTSSGSTQHAFSTGLTLSNVGTGGTASHRAVFAGTVQTAGYTVATLPAAGTAGRKAYVTDATAPTFLGALTGGGTVVTPVFDNGTAWVSA